jgi:hypothetical protein
MKRFESFRRGYRTVIIALVSLLTPITLGAGHGAEVAYKFKILDIPLHFTFLGEERDNIRTVL